MSLIKHHLVVLALLNYIELSTFIFVKHILCAKFSVIFYFFFFILNVSISNISCFTLTNFIRYFVFVFHFNFFRFRFIVLLHKERKKNFNCIKHQWKYLASQSSMEIHRKYSRKAEILNLFSFFLKF